MQYSDHAHSTFPLWLELSGLPLHLNMVAKAPFAWSVFRKIVELDIAVNRLRPGTIEVSIAELAERCGIEPEKVHKAIKGMRKAGLARAFVPDNDEEPALFQIITPVPTPGSPDEVRARYPDFFLDTDWPPRYAVEIKDDEDEERQSDRDAKVKRVVELYLNAFSMKINSLILDQLQLISDRYEMPLIEKVFDRAKKREATSLGWIMTEIRREMKVKRIADELKREELESK